MIGRRPGICRRIRIESRGTRITLRPVKNPLRDAEVKASPQVWVRKAVNRKIPAIPPFQISSLEKVSRLAQAKGSKSRQAMAKRTNKKLAGVVSGRASLTMANDVPQKNDTINKTALAKKGFEAMAFIQASIFCKKEIHLTALTFLCYLRK